MPLIQRFNFLLLLTEDATRIFSELGGLEIQPIHGLSGLKFSVNESEFRRQIKMYQCIQLHKYSLLFSMFHWESLSKDAC